LHAALTQWAKSPKGKIAMKKQSTIVTSTVPTFEALLEKMMPHFTYFVKKMKRRYKRFDIDDAMQDLVGFALENYHSLVRRGKQTFFTPIMKFAIKRYCAGRRFVGTSSTDVLSEQTQRLGKSRTCQLSAFDGVTDTWYFMDDKKPNVFRTVQTKLDYHDWYHRHSAKDQQIIQDLAMGETTNDVAKKYGVTPGAISQRRKTFEKSWNAFIDPPENDSAVVSK